MKRWLMSIFVIGLLIGGITGCSINKSSRTLVEYHRSGGILGFTDHLVIMKDGEATLTRKTERYEFVLETNHIKDLQKLFEETRFNQLGKEYLPPQEGADFIEYRVSYDGHTVLAKDGAVPDALWPVLESLNQIIDNYLHR
jgi:hypothetical protein